MPVLLQQDEVAKEKKELLQLLGVSRRSNSWFNIILNKYNAFARGAFLMRPAQ